MIDAADENHRDEPPAPTGSDDAPAGRTITSTRPGLTPQQVIRSDADARIILGLWTIRKAWLPLLWIGLTVATVYFTMQGRDFNELQDRIVELEQGNSLLQEVMSPLSLATLAVLMRLAVLPLGWAAAFPLTLFETQDDHTESNWFGRRTRLWRDRLHLARGYATLRWTWVVRYAAIDRLGTPHSMLARSTRVLKWIGIVAFIAYFVATMVAVASLA
jgi:hypothetical protein